MPDADDVDVEYLRSLLGGESGEKEREAPVKRPARPTAPKGSKKKAGPAAGRPGRASSRRGAR